jgi:signal transduction histidine kinase
LLTGNPRYLEPFTSATESLPESLADVKRLIADNPSQQRRVADLERLTSQKMVEVRRTIDLYRNGQAAAALAIVQGDEGKESMDRARAVIAAMRTDEDEQLSAHTVALQRRFDTATVIGACAGVGLAVLGFILFKVNRDIAHREQLEHELRAEGRFQQQFIGILGHDLRNPLNAISLSLQQLKLGSPERQEVAFKRAEAAAARMSRMIAQLLDLTRVRIGNGIPVEPQPDTSLTQLVDSTVEEVQAVHPDARLRVDLEREVRGSWDPDRMAQLVSNLLTNAIAYGDGTVDIRVRCSDSSAILEVHNGGTPIPEDIVPRIFEPFQRATEDNRTPAPGLGLGLFIAQQVVAAHGGRIAVRSTASEGTTFSVDLPIGRAAPRSSA